jgi:hypothetical protein
LWSTTIALSLSLLFYCIPYYGNNDAQVGEHVDGRIDAGLEEDNNQRLPWKEEGCVAECDQGEILEKMEDKNWAQLTESTHIF